MKSASTALEAFLESGAPFYGADLYEITPVNGSAFRATTFDRPILYGGHVYPVARWGADQVMMKRSRIKMAVGLVASKIDVEMIANPDAQIAGQPALEALATGKWANASVTVRRCFMTPGDVNYNGVAGPAICNLTGAPTGQGDGTLVWFAGNVGQVGPIETLRAMFEVRDLIYQLNRPAPKNLISPGCWHQLFDAGCALSQASFTVTGTIQAGSTAQVVNTGLTNDTNIPGAPTAGPSLSSTNTGVALAAATYYVQATYVTALGETLASPETSIACPPNNVPIIASPVSVTGASFWNCYIGLESGNEQKQNGDPIPIGTGYNVPATGINLTGIVPPAFPTNGYWSQGVITFTSGVLAGISAYVEASAPSGAVSLRVPLPAPPSAGDTFTIIPGCDKLFTTCQGKFSNIAHFSGAPFVPVPESGL